MFAVIKQAKQSPKILQQCKSRYGRVSSTTITTTTTTTATAVKRRIPLLQHWLLVYPKQLKLIITTTTTNWVQRVFNRIENGSFSSMSSGLSRLKQLTLKYNRPLHNLPSPPQSNKLSFLEKYKRMMSTEHLVNWILALNGVVFLMWQTGFVKKDQSLIRFMNNNFVFSIDNMEKGRLWTIFTCSFSQKEFPHFVFNTVSLYSIGHLLAPLISPVAFLQLYLFSAAASCLSHVLYTHLLTRHYR